MCVCGGEINTLVCLDYIRMYVYLNKDTVLD